MLQRKLAAALPMLLAFIFSGLSVHGQSTNVPLRALLVERDRPLERNSTSESSSFDATTEPAAVVARQPPGARAVKEQPALRPFSTFAAGLKVDSLGAGAEMATPLSRSLNVRAGVNILAYGYPFDIDEVHYDSDLHFRSAQVNLDWFPTHGRFHISPGLIYVQNSLKAVASVPAGQYFELGDQGFINSVDQPVSGSATLTFPRRFAPTLMAGFGNLIPRTGKHLSTMFEVGAAFTGQPHIDVHLNGTACTYDGCFDMATDPTQQTLKDEVGSLNSSLRSIPVYPIVSLGMAYRF